LRYFRFSVSYAQYLDHKDAFGALNSDNSRLIRLFSNRCLLLGPYGQQVRLKPGEQQNKKTNMNDAQLKLSSQICFPLYSASV
jgi:hypothetical protein